MPRKSGSAEQAPRGGSGRKPRYDIADFENAEAYRGFIVGLVSVFFCVLVSGFGGVRVVVSAPTHDAIIISRVYKRMGLLCTEHRTKTSRFQDYSVRTRKCLDKALEQGKAHVVVYLGALQSTVW
jgi:hypothetical protein